MLDWSAWQRKVCVASLNKIASSSSGNCIPRQFAETDYILNSFSEESVIIKGNWLDLGITSGVTAVFDLAVYFWDICSDLT